MSQRGKGKGIAFPNDFIALGSKSGSGVTGSGPSVGGGAGTKREGTPVGVGGSSAPSVVSKKAKIPSSVPRVEEWESLALDLDENSLDKFVELVSNSDKSINYLGGAVKLLRNQRAKPDQVLYLSLLYLAKSGSPHFHSDSVTRAFSSLLKRDAKENYKSKGNPLVPVLAANVLMAAYASERHWPDIFVRVYIEDALGERVWVDHPDCKSFVDNVLTAFNTKPRDNNCPSPPIGGSASGSGSATPTRTDEDSLQSIEQFNTLEDYGAEVSKRYERNQELIEQIVMEIVREQLNRRSQGENVTKNFLKFLTNACGLIEVRLAVMPKIEVWMMNIHQKISRPAQELLLSVAINCNTHSAKDVEVIGHFNKLRFKSKQNVNLFLASVRELCGAHHENLPTLVKHTLFNELSNCRNINNMSMLSVMFSVDGDRAAASLATVFIELLLQKECYLRALRFLLREIVRVLKNDINLHYFCHYLMNECPKEALIKDFEFKDRMFKSMTDLVTVAMFLGISSHVRESITSYLRGEKKDYTPYRVYLTQVAKIQNEALIWLHERVPKIFKPEGQAGQASYQQCLHKILFMLNLVSVDEYIRIDGWPAENDRNLFFKAAGEIPITQDSLILLFYIGMSKNLPLNGLDTIHLAEELIKRAAGLQPIKSEDFPIIYIDKPEEIIRCLFQLATYNYPDSITLPPDYKPPILAISTAYWKAWMILVLLAAHNPGEFGKLALESYPTLIAFMEMTITNQFTFPPPTIAIGEIAEELRSKEFQIHQLERHSILELENHLAKPNVISESNSLLLPQLITMDPHGELRKPPEQVLDQLKKLNSLHKIGHLLCRSRKPDFLLDILQRQGSNQAMPWLADLVESSEGSFNVLPVQCLCEFLLNSSSSFIEAESCKIQETEAATTKRRKQKRLLLHLQNLLQNPNSDLGTCLETLDYFLRRLSSPQTSARIQALTGLRLVLTPIVHIKSKEGDEDVIMEEEDETPFFHESGDDWLLKRLPELPTFRKFYPHITQQLRNACQVENDPDTVSLYIQFLARYAPTDSLDALADLSLDMATFIVERSTLFPSLLPGSACKSKNSSDTFHALLRLFTGYMLRIVSNTNDQNHGPQWSDNQQELFTVYWPNGVSATLSFFVIHAQIILLTYGPSDIPEFEQMIRIWHNPELPRAFNVHLSEEAVLIPDWLKLKMIRSNIDCLVDSALKDLNPGQLVLFIQSFGIPVKSMTKLLKALDEAVVTDVDAVNESVMDKTYMGQLVAVQHQRGALGGDKFARALDLNYQEEIKMKKEEIIGGNESVPNVSPRTTVLIPPNQVKNTLMNLFEVGSSANRLSNKEKQDTFRTLQKKLSMSESMPLMDATVKALHTIIKSDSLRDPFILSLNKKIPFSCSLFRLLTSSQIHSRSTTAKNTLLKIAQMLLKQGNDGKKRILRLPLMKILEDFTSRNDLEVKEEQDEMEDDDEPYEILRCSSRIHFEDSVSKLMSVALGDKEKVPELVEAMARLVLGKSQYSKDVKEVPDMDSKIGLLIDWLSILSPELIKSSPDLHRLLLFSKEYSVPSRPYLASTLVHHSSWKEIQTTMNSVLEQFRKELDPSAVLDFIESIHANPRLRKGRDKHVPKHEVPENILNLSEAQLIVVIQYVLLEAKSDINLIHNRMDVMLKILLYGDQVRTVVHYLNSRIHNKYRLIRVFDGHGNSSNEMMEDSSKNEGSFEAVKELILQIYIKIPNSIFTLKYASDDVFPSKILCEKYTSPMDSVSHALLTTLACTQHGRSWASQMQVFDLALRKISSSHPLLMLRNLSLLTSALKGRTNFEFGVFKSRNHMTLYSMSLGLLELLRPHVYEEEHRESLHDGLGCYFEMIEAYFNRRESMFGLIDRFLSFMRDYCLNHPKIAVPFVKKFGKKLPELADKMPNLASLKFLVSGIEWTEDSCSTSTSLNPKVVHRYKASLSTVPPEVKRLSSKFSSLSNNLEDEDDSIRILASSDSISSALSELTSYTSSKPEILYTHFLREILFYMKHPIKSLRAQSHSLFVSLLKHKPSRSVELIDGYIKCLESSDPGIVNSALERLSDIAVLAQESLREILQIVFSLGHLSNYNVNPYLSKTLSVINSHSGY
ncbi:integrator complex subunit 1 [Lepeophtheirus salmonis]|uniref:integrator complex subunit 1 n=1 Tax=Lepeophtheirus salmonis TaxID=72036 RepID=UPI001AE28165|nr:integrator complex subunit 1-like [Lepeophtheirus salmonis]